MTTKEKMSQRQNFSTVNAQMSVKRQTFAATNDQPAREVLILTGYPILWNQNSTDRGGYAVRLAPGSAAFTTPVLALFNHSWGQIIGSTLNGSLKIGQSDQTGVPVEIEIDLNNCTQAAKDVATLVSGKFIGGMSFSMAEGFEEYTESKEGDTQIINVTKFTCDEVSIVANPAFATASVSVADPEDDQEEAPPVARISASAKLLAARLHTLRQPA